MIQNYDLKAAEEGFFPFSNTQQICLNKELVLEWEINEIYFVNGGEIA